jgi:signal peptidase II
MLNWWNQSRSEGRILTLCAAVLLLDQLTKLLIVSVLRLGDQRPVLSGFLHVVHWGNTGSAWSLFHGNNRALAVLALMAVIALWYWRHHFEAQRPMGQLALGLLFGGTIGNLVDRLLPARQHVVDFLYFHLRQRDGGEIGFPAFNVADVAICTGVGLMLLLGFIPKPEPDRGSGSPPHGGE